MLQVLYIGLFIVLGAVLAELLRMTWLGVRIIWRQKTKPSSFIAENPEQHVVLIGDSVGVGVGALDPKNSIAGRIARAFPNAHVSNWSKSVKGLGWVARRLEKEHQSGTPAVDLVIILAGGIDISYGFPMRMIRRSLTRVIRASKQLAPQVVVIGPYNIGYSPLVRFPLSRLFAARAAQADKLFKEVCTAEGALFTTLYDENDCLMRYPEITMPDKSHPNDVGYGIWWDRVKETVALGLKPSHVASH